MGVNQMAVAVAVAVAVPVAMAMTVAECRRRDSAILGGHRPVPQMRSIYKPPLFVDYHTKVDDA
jgi:hypothetical protein